MTSLYEAVAQQAGIGISIPFTPRGAFHRREHTLRRTRVLARGKAFWKPVTNNHFVARTIPKRATMKWK
jgi:hypothetical protein